MSWTELLVRRRGDDSIVTIELPCASCGYLVTGLPLRGACPECGTPVRAALRPVARPDRTELALRAASDGCFIDAIVPPAALVVLLAAGLLLGGLARGVVIGGSIVTLGLRGAGTLGLLAEPAFRAAGPIAVAARRLLLLLAIEATALGVVVVLPAVPGVALRSPVVAWAAGGWFLARIAALIAAASLADALGARLDVPWARRDARWARWGVPAALLLAPLAAATLLATAVVPRLLAVTAGLALVGAATSAGGLGLWAALRRLAYAVHAATLEIDDVVDEATIPTTPTAPPRRAAPAADVPLASDDA